DQEASAFTVSYSAPSKENIILSLPMGDGAPIVDENGQKTPWKTNPITQRKDIVIRKPGVYGKDIIVNKNVREFPDMIGQSESIRKAAAFFYDMGIVAGTSADTFSPELPLNRAQSARLFTLTANWYNQYSDGRYVDVRPEDWFFGAAGSAKEKGIMTGTNAAGNLFSPYWAISRVQFFSIAGRMLRLKMHYYVIPEDSLEQVLDYTDRPSLPDWALQDIALVTKVGLVRQNSGKIFDPDHIMTRAESLEALYALHEKLWPAT
ncbi:MAG: S-layer homology domain-containing protein, partial [Clostridiales bacterium]|nr:S-layer homology domain-containing protein [Clostridiales bacterium]